MLTSRDYEVIDFVRRFKVASASSICTLYFPSQRVGRNRLRTMTDAGVLKRCRESVNNEYIYFIKRPKQLLHSLVVTQFYAQLRKECEVIKFNIEPVYGDIRPDAAFVYKHNGIKAVGLLEVELSNKGFDWHKYERFLAGQYRQFMTAPPDIFVAAAKPVPNVKYVSLPITKAIL